MSSKMKMVINTYKRTNKKKTSDDEDKVSNPYKRTNKKKNRKKSMQQQLQERYEAEDPEVILLGEPSGRGFKYYVLCSRPKLPDHIMPEINMFQHVSQDFPSSDFERDDVKHSWKKEREKLIGPLSKIKDIDADIEFLFSKDDEPSKDTILAMKFKYESSDDSSKDNFEEVQNKFDVLDLCPMELCQRTAADATPLVPNAKIYVLPNKYDKSIPVIAYFDTGASDTFMKPEILPTKHWKKCST
ncbi:hypothetical protein LIER_11412 [Lithospermum erythrorhizon]|uniref:Polyprotein n=1 Tax=Lithospermum erythrorhizon TaxID=34254 RepID=A0AAV3PRZ6_LITER